MRILLIRHADPDYEHDCLTKTGIEEAKALGEFYKDFHYDRIISSPMPRALLTAKELEKYHKDIPLEVDEHLKEFSHKITLPDLGEKNRPWDLLPSYFSKQDEFYDNKRWFLQKVMKKSEMETHYQKITSWLDSLLSEFGYQREGRLYRCENGNHKVLVLVCHFGMMSVLLSHLLNISFTQLSDGTVCAPSGVSELYTEERRKGIVKWRMSRFGDISHLSKVGRVASFAARFCEVYEDDTRHD